MESFKIKVVLDGAKTELLVIPDDGYDRSLFHLISGGNEVSKIEFLDIDDWVVIEGKRLLDSELKTISKKIEFHYSI